MQMLRFVCAPSFYYFSPHLWFSDSILSLSAWVTLLWHVKLTIALKRRVSAHGNNDNVCLHEAGFLLILHANHAAHRKRCITERKEERGRLTSLSPSLISQDMSFLMDFHIFVCEVMWYVSIRLWLAHGASNWWSSCSCANITLIHPFLLLSVTVSKPLCHIFSPKICFFFII